MPDTIAHAEPRRGFSARAVALAEKWDGLPHWAIRRYTKLMPGDSEYDDAVQECRITLLHCGEKWDPSRGAKFKTYAVHALWHSLIRWNQKRHGYLDRNHSMDEPNAAGVVFSDCWQGKEADPADVAEHKDELANLRKSLDTLTDRQREMVEFRVRGFNLREIAFFCRCTSTNVGVVLGDAYARLRKEMGT